MFSSLIILQDPDKILKVFVNIKRTSSAIKAAGDSKVSRSSSPKNKGIPNNEWKVLWNQSECSFYLMSYTVCFLALLLHMTFLLKMSSYFFLKSDNFKKTWTKWIGQNTNLNIFKNSKSPFTANSWLIHRLIKLAVSWLIFSSSPKE